MKLPGQPRLPKPAPQEPAPVLSRAQVLALAIQRANAAKKAGLPAPEVVGMSAKLREAGYVVSDGGVWESRLAYEKGIAVTFAGGLWIAVRDASRGEKPGECDAFRLAVRRGKDGPEGPVGPPPNHQWDGTKLRFEQADGTWGKWVDLRGPKGDAGYTVVVGGVGSGTASSGPASVNSFFPGGWR